MSEYYPGFQNGMRIGLDAQDELAECLDKMCRLYLRDLNRPPTHEELQQSFEVCVAAALDEWAPLPDGQMRNSLYHRSSRPKKVGAR